MKILLEVNPLWLAHKTGVPYFIEALASALLGRIEEQEPATRDELILWGPNLEHDPFPQFRHKTLWRGGITRDVRELLWYHFRCGGVPRGVDIYHLPFLAPIAPHHTRTRFVATIYDLAFMHFPDIAPSSEVFVKQVEWTLRQSCQSDAVFTISQATKRDIIQAFDVPDEKIHVVYPGTNIAPPEDTDAAGRAAYEELRLPPRYVVCVGTWEPRKNLPLLLRAWDKLRPTGVKLALCGVKGWKFQHAEALLDELQLHDSVQPLGYVAREAMPHLYANAQFLAFPALYEGFGLPVVEAMKCGCPVICSDSSSLPEAAGDAAWLLPPRDVDAWAAAMGKMLDDAALRQSLREKGFAQAKKFSWEDAARQTLEIYRGLIESP